MAKIRIANGFEGWIKMVGLEVLKVLNNIIGQFLIKLAAPLKRYFPAHIGQ